MCKWTIVEQGEAFFEAVLAKSPSVSDPIRATVKWDGCVELRHDGSHASLVHVCDLDGFVKHLTELRELAKERF